MIADWKGTEHPEQVVVVSGHLDSWDLGTGAIDDGAGVVVSMQAIQLMQQLGIHPEATVRVVAWMDEEEARLERQLTRRTTRRRWKIMWVRSRAISARTSDRHLLPGWGDAG